MHTDRILIPTDSPRSPNPRKKKPDRGGTSETHSREWVAALRRHCARSDDAHAFVADPSEHVPGRRGPRDYERAREFLVEVLSGEPLTQEDRYLAVPDLDEEPRYTLFE